MKKIKLHLSNNYRWMIGNHYISRRTACILLTLRIAETDQQRRMGMTDLEKVQNFCEQKKNACDKNVEVIGMDNMLTPPWQTNMGMSNAYWTDLGGE